MKQVYAVNRFRNVLSAAVAVLCLCGSVSAKGGVTRSDFGKMPNGTPVSQYTMTNSHGMVVQVISYGGIIKSITTPDRTGKFGDVTLGFDKLDYYVKESPFFGALIGRYANRIAGGHFKLNGHTYKLPINNKPNSLHGGTVGFDKVVWNVSAVNKANNPQLILTHVSKDGDQGYPGTLKVKVVYTLTDNNELRIDYSATTDKPTVVNLTSHPYFNLAGAGNRTILPTQVQIFASKFTPIDKNSIPYGKLENVNGTVFDFRTPATIGSRIGKRDTQLVNGTGYDHNYVLDHKIGTLSLSAHVTDPRSGRVLDVYTTEPGLQFYSGNYVNIPKGHGKGGTTYSIRSGFCLEAQHYPDSPNKPNFPSTVLKPGQTYHQTTIYKFSAGK